MIATYTTNPFNALSFHRGLLATTEFSYAFVCHEEDTDKNG